jgi:hypothetical protein
MRALRAFIIAMAVSGALLVVGSAEADPSGVFRGPLPQSSGGRPLIFSPAQACFGVDGWISADYSGEAKANRAADDRAHVKATVSLNPRVSPDGFPPNTYEGHATVEVDGWVVADQFPDQGYLEIPVRIEMIPIGAGAPIAVIWPVQVWVSWGPGFIGVSVSHGVETCAPN